MSLVLYACAIRVVPLLTNPMSLGVAVSVLSFFCRLVICYDSTWFSVIRLVIYVGGLMVSLCYFVCLIPNQKRRFKISQVVGGLTGRLVLRQFEYDILSSMAKRREITDIFSPANNMGFIFLAAFLLHAMLVVVSVRKVVSGPLRGLN